MMERGLPAAVSVRAACGISMNMMIGSARDAIRFLQVTGEIIIRGIGRNTGTGIPYHGISKILISAEDPEDRPVIP